MNNSNNGLGLSSVLLIVFVILKLCKVIDWSWFWVLSPLWVSIIIFIGVLLLFYW